MMTASDLSFGDEVVIPWGVDEVHAQVREVYGHPPKIYVVLDLTPELSDQVVDEATTVTLPLASIIRIEPALP